MRKYLLCAALLALLAPSCTKDKDMKKATVVDSGDISAGGCGYLLRIEEDGSEIRPKYLPSAYQHDGQKVKVKFTTGEGYVCNTHPTKKFITDAEILDIKRDLD